MKSKKPTFFLVLFQVIFSSISHGITPNAIVSRGKTVYTSSGTTTYLNDGKYAGFNPGNNHLVTMSANSWIAINLVTAYTQVFFSWSNPNHSWSDVVSSSQSCKMTPVMPIDYTIQASSNSTNGSNGTWTTLVTIKGNVVTNRGHKLNMNGASWIKMSISNGGGPIDEIEAFDLKNNGTDIWFFPGTSITAYSFKEYADRVSQSYADLVKQKYPKFTPAVIRGGIGCIRSSAFKDDVQKYIANAGNANYWAIEMGTNDAMQSGSTNVASYKSNLQAIISACKNAGIQPIIARTIATNPAKTTGKWQVDPSYLKAVDELTTSNGLIAGPDFYSYFLAHPDELRGDGIHPSTTGAASIQRMWAEKMASVYSTVTSVDEEEEISSDQTLCFPNPFSNELTISAKSNFEYSIFDLNGIVLEKGVGENSTSVAKELPSGIYLVKIESEGRSTFLKVVKN